MPGFNLEYPITRPFTFRYFTCIIFASAGIWFIIITLINIVAVAYETIPFMSTDYYASSKMWYDIFVPTFWRPLSRSCDASIIPLNGGRILTLAQTNLKGLSTNQSVFQYTLRGYLDPNADALVDGMQYEGNDIGNCSVQLLQISQFLWAPVNDQVNSATPGANK
jgi:hypothetical protein